MGSISYYEQLLNRYLVYVYIYIHRLIAWPLRTILKYVVKTENIGSIMKQIYLSCNLNKKMIKLRTNDVGDRKTGKKLKLSKLSLGFVYGLNQKLHSDVRTSM